MPAPLQGAYKSSTYLRRLVFRESFISPLKGEVDASAVSRRKGCARLPLTFCTKKDLKPVFLRTSGLFVCVISKFHSHFLIKCISSPIIASTFSFSTYATKYKKGNKKQQSCRSISHLCRAAVVIFNYKTVALSLLHTLMPLLPAYFLSKQLACAIHGYHSEFFLQSP